MAVTLPRGGEAALEDIEALSLAGLPAQDVLEEAAARIDRVVPAAARFFAAADPDTGLCMGAGTSDMPEEMCRPYWEYEFHVPDFNKFADLGRASLPVADLHQATGGRPSRSARWRAFADLLGWDGELRAAFTVGGATWGVAQLTRGAGDRPFSQDEIDFVAHAAGHIARGLRQGLTMHAATPSVERGPGMAIVDAEGRLVSMTDEAAAWLQELPSSQVSYSGDGDLTIELAALAAATRARAADGGGAQRIRMRARSGVWLLAHASVLGGTDGHVALVIEPAKASEVAPLIIEAYGLTPRELEVTRLIARGMRTGEIAAQLFLSPHTVRDHVKAIFEKVGVSSRGELVATMFADHYHGTLDAAITASHVQA